jgi:hypothetical protein
MAGKSGFPAPKVTSSSTPPNTSQQENIKKNVIDQLNARGEEIEYEETTAERRGFLKEEMKRRDVAFEEYTRMNEEGKQLALDDMEEKERNWIVARILKEESQMKSSNRLDRTPSQPRVRTDPNAPIKSWFNYTNEVRGISQEAHSKTDVDKVDGSRVVEKMEELINILSQEFDDEATAENAYLETISETLRDEFKLNPAISRAWDPLVSTYSGLQLFTATERVRTKWLEPLEADQLQMQYADLQNLPSRQKLVGPMVFLIQKWCNLMQKVLTTKNNSDIGANEEEKMVMATKLQTLNQRSRQLVTSLNSATQSAAMVKEMVEMDSPEVWSARPPPHQHASVFKDHSRSSGVMSLSNEPTKAMLALQTHAGKMRKDLSEAIKKQTWEEGVSLASLLSRHTYERELAKNQYMLNTAWCEDSKRFSIVYDVTLRISDTQAALSASAITDWKKQHPLKNISSQGVRDIIQEMYELNLQKKGNTQLRIAGACAVLSGKAND